MSLTMPHGTVEVLLNGKWESVVSTDNPDKKELKEIADMYNATEVRYIEDKTVMSTYSFK